MLQADRAEFARLLTGMAAVKPQLKLTAEALEIWWLAMAAWSLDEFRSAIAHVVRTCDFVSPKSFEDLRRAQLPTAGEAWARVLEAVRTSSYHGGIDPIIDRAVAACGGYRAIGMTTDDGLPFMERRFAEHFESVTDAIETREALGYDSTPRLGGVKSIAQLLDRSTA